MTDPRDLRGSIAGPGGPHDRNGVVLDTTRAVLLDGVEVCAVEPASGSPAGMIALLLSGRVNQTRDRADVLYLFDVDGAAAIVTELLALAHRMDARGLAGVIRQRLAQLDAEGGLVNPLVEVIAERSRQDARWGQQDHPNGTGPEIYWTDSLGNCVDADEVRDLVRERCQEHFADGSGAWLDILLEEVGEAFAEADPAALRQELIQIAAVAVAWVEAIDRAAR